MERIILHAPWMWKQWARDTPTSVGPACKTLRCSLQMINFVRECLPGMINGWYLSYDSCEKPILLSTLSRPLWSMNGRRGRSCLLKNYFPARWMVILWDRPSFGHKLFNFLLLRSAHWTLVCPCTRLPCFCWHVFVGMLVLKEDICCTLGRSVKIDTIDISGSVSFSSSNSGLSASSGVNSHSLWGVCSKPGTFHHEGCRASSDGNSSLAGQSAGLSSLLTWCQQVVGGKF